MELRVLKYFLTVAQEESFSRAAEKLHLSQPTLSRQLKDLEDEFGKQLLIREPRRILLTEDGQLLRRRAEEILSLVDKTTGELLCNEEISGDIRIGAGESIHFGLVMHVAQKLRQKYPGLRFHIVSGDGATTMTRLERGLIDFAFVYGKLDPANIRNCPCPSATAGCCSCAKMMSWRQKRSSGQRICGKPPCFSPGRPFQPARMAMSCAAG